MDHSRSHYRRQVAGIHHAKRFARAEDLRLAVSLWPTMSRDPSPLYKNRKPCARNAVMTSTSQKLITAVAGISTVTSIWLYLDNRSLRGTAEKQSAALVASQASKADPWNQPTSPGDTGGGVRASRTGAISAPEMPVLAEPPKESRMNRRARMTEEFAAMFGRLDGETDDEYKARVMPLVKVGLDKRRTLLANNRAAAEAKAGVTPEQHAALDKAFGKTFTDVIDYANTAVKDGQISPYERNVSGWLEFAGGLGGMLNETEGGIKKILSAEQIKAMSSSGFEWGEYLGVSAPWEDLKPPPPRPR